MLEKIKLGLKLLGLLRDVKNVDVPAEKLGAKRAGKSLVAAVIVAVIGFLTEQHGPSCQLGPKACEVIADPLIWQILAVPFLLGVEKIAKEKYGLGI